MKKLICFLSVITGLMFAQMSIAKGTKKSYSLEVEGVVKEVKENKNLVSVAFNIVDEHRKKLGVYYSDELGKCNFKLPIGRHLILNISKKGYVTKIVHINTCVPVNKKSSDPFLFDVCLFETVKGIDVSILRKPIANITYLDYMNCFFYNYAYTDMVNNKLKKAYSDYYRLHSNSDSSKYIQSQEKVYCERINDVKEKLAPIVNESLIQFSTNSNKKREIPLDKVFVPGIVLKIQIISVKNPIPLNSPIFNGCGKVEEYILDNTYKYTIGEYLLLEDAQDSLTQILNITSCDDAFIIAFVGEKRITVGEALKIQSFRLRGL